MRKCLEISHSIYKVSTTNVISRRVLGVGLGLAEAVGIKGMRVDRPSDLVESLRTAFAHRGFAVLDVRVNRQELSKPPSAAEGTRSSTWRRPTSARCSPHSCPARARPPIDRQLSPSSLRSNLLAAAMAGVTIC